LENMYGCNMLNYLLCSTDHLITIQNSVSHLKLNC